MSASSLGRNVTTKCFVGPAQLKRRLPRKQESLQCGTQSRQAIVEVLSGRSDRLILIVGPCSIHDPASALEYALRLSKQRTAFHEDLEIVMRVYFEKPRTTVGWKGLINDPYLDSGYAIGTGIELARQLMIDIIHVGVPVATEFLDTVTPQYVADLVGRGAIGARTTKSQIHREMASGLPCLIVFKNSTDGNIKVAIDAIHSHHFLGIGETGKFARVVTPVNRHCHVVLRSGKQPNSDAASVAEAGRLLCEAGLSDRLIIDASHGNSGKLYENQLQVCASLSAQISADDDRIAGVMIESNLVAGRQNSDRGRSLVFGQSITDAGIGWEETETCLQSLADASKRSRLRSAPAATKPTLQPTL